MTIKNINAYTAKQWLDSGEAILIDVREPAEHAAQKIAGAMLRPVGAICCDAIPKTNKKIIIHCQKGIRGDNACRKLLAENSNLDVYNLEGGIETWEQAGFSLKSTAKPILPLDRQVQLTIGLSVLTFSLLGYFAHPIFTFGAALFGAGLINSGLTGWCGLARLMMKMPWNQ